MKPLSEYAIRPGDWHADRGILRAIREEVFVREQSVPAEMEMDEFDAQSHHVVAIADGVAIGTGRLLPDGHIGRMAVLGKWRNQGVGSALLVALIDEARKRGVSRVVLNAQIHALPFYLRHGFQAEGEEFLDAGIAHRKMWREL
jgi:predicted GNAT family N-acyltransferase